jgi:hypothetical protein
MFRRMKTLLAAGVLAALPAGAAFAQSATTVPNTGGITPETGGQGVDRANGLAGAAGDDTRTPAQVKAGRMDAETPAVPGDQTRPGEIQSTTPKRKTTTSTTVEKKSTTLPDDSATTHKSDLDKDIEDSDK